jgi:hypothetical protein
VAERVELERTAMLQCGVARKYDDVALSGTRERQSVGGVMQDGVVDLGVHADKLAALGPELL